MGAKVKLQISTEIFMTLAISFAIAAMVAGGIAALGVHARASATTIEGAVSGAYNSISGFEYRSLCSESQGVTA